MPPKFHGDDEDDWVDEPRRPKSKKTVVSRYRPLAPEEGNAVVAELFPNQAVVLVDGEPSSRLCAYQLATLVAPGLIRERSPVCVGDRVLVEEGLIVGRCERRNRLVRPAPNSRDPLIHALAANLDCLVVVAAAREPHFSGGIVDRFLVAASAQSIPAVVCVNKIDLAGSERPWAAHAEAGIELFEVCAKTGRGLEALAARVRGKAAAFCGHSGVGKTSLLRRLLGDDSYGRVGAVSEAGGMGRHTTAGAVLIPGTSWIDTPGIMNFGLLDVRKEDLLRHFPELARAAAACAKGCAHQDCGVSRQARFESYRQLLASL